MKSVDEALQFWFTFVPIIAAIVFVFIKFGLAWGFTLVGVFFAGLIYFVFFKKA